jgi:hypothetical protein
VVLGSVLLPAVYQWDNYDELYFIQDGEQHKTWRFLLVDWASSTKRMFSARF